MRLTQDQVKACSSLANAPSFYVVKQLLESELEINLKTLMTTKDITILHQAQGKTQLLTELITAFN